MKKYNIVLASSSPRRKALLDEAGVSYISTPPELDEKLSPGLPPSINAENIAMDKAMVVSKQYPDVPVLAADTIVALGKTMIGKPASVQEAENILRSLSGKEHQVVTGVAVVHAQKGTFWKSSATTNVRFKNISHKEIAEYAAGGEPMDKAGAYAIQGGAASWVDSYDGSFTNIIGLPMEMVKLIFHDLGYDLF